MSKNFDSQVAEIEEPDLDELETKRELKKYIRVGDKYYKETYKPDKKRHLHRVFVERQKGTIIDDFGKHSLKKIKKYEDFCVVPSHINYEVEVKGHFNEYYEITHQPNDGDCSTILPILKHIFGDKMDFILDYLKLMYERPYQRLPIILLESEERGTGKSSFGDLIFWMFQSNAVKLGNGDLESDFNAVWVKRLAIIIDETSLDKKSIMQMIKRLSTETGKITSNEKNKAKTEIDFFGKFIFMSNDEGKALPIEKGETRFAVFKVPTFKENNIQKIPNLEPIIKSEIPAFLHFLQNRELFHNNRDRMYFDFEAYQTPQLNQYFKNSISYIARAISQLVKDTFTMFPDENELSFSLANIILELKDNVRGLEREKLRKAVEDELKLYPQKKNHYTYYSLKQAESSLDYTTKKNNQNNVYYTFIR